MQNRLNMHLFVFIRFIVLDKAKEKTISDRYVGEYLSFDLD